jgi:hypothetical protein
LNRIFVRLAAFATLWGCGDDPAALLLQRAHGSCKAATASPRPRLARDVEILHGRERFGVILPG